MSLEKARKAIDEASSEDLRVALRAFVGDDESAAVRVLGLLGKADFDAACESMLAEMDGLWVRYEHKGYVDCDRAFFFECDLKQVIDEAVSAFMKEGGYLHAHALSCAALVRIQNYSVDESGDFTGSVTDACIECWHDILERLEGSPDEHDIRARIVSWAQGFTRQNPGTDESGEYFSQIDSVEDFLFVVED